jgi:hypothetical protein
MRGVIKFLLSLIVVLALAWLGLWWYAQGRLQKGFEAWADTQATTGWKISYDSIQRGTSPLHAVVNITNLTLTPPAAGGATGAITLPTFALRIDAANPLVFHSDLPNKISLQFGPDVDAVINTGSIALTENLDPAVLFNSAAYPFRGGDFAASNVDLLASQGSLLVLHIDAITSHADLNLGANSSATAMHTTTEIDGFALSPILTRIASIPFDGKINRLTVAATLSGPVPAGLPALVEQLRTVPEDTAAQQQLIIPIIHQWASQGGSGSISLGLAIGPSTAKADAAVKFDANLQPNGTADLTADHLDEFTATITAAYPQFQQQTAQAEALLTPYITTTDQGGQTLGINLAYGSPGVTINGTKVADMPPVDWTTLENPAVVGQ